ncbi:MAG: hypothetical protein IT452_09415 [Planctomycetia bacterium]|nr:hypothetical protein [Planctomycetia bacterium]
MQLEFLADGSEDCPLIRLFGFSVEDLRQLCSVFQTCSRSPAGSHLQLHSQPFVASIRGCTLTLSVGAHSLGVQRTGRPAEFICILDPESWIEARERAETLLDPIAESAYQWICDGDVKLLLSKSGQW